MTLARTCTASHFTAPAVAMLPMRRQVLPAPRLVVWTRLFFTRWPGLLPLAAVLSLFRTPLRLFRAGLCGPSPHPLPELC
jgi:hypothetical protein